VLLSFSPAIKQDLSALYLYREVFLTCIFAASAGPNILPSI